MTIDHRTAAQRMADLVGAVPDGALGDPTPCPDYTVGDLLDHIHGFARAFTFAARKDLDPIRERPGPGSAGSLDPEWRTAIPADLAVLATAWAEPGAQEGMSMAGGMDFPAEVVAVVAMEELVVHGWDLARAVGADYSASPPELAIAAGFLEQIAGPEGGGPDGAFGPMVPTADGAPELDRLLGLSGRDPGWTRPG
jgi:uncharacterized protein (TIGR03086 family)